MAKRAKPPSKAPVEKDPLLLAIGTRVLEARRELRLSQGELAKKAGITASSVFAAEKGAQNLTIKSLERLATALEVRIKDLLPDAEPTADPDPASQVAKALIEELGRTVMLAKRIGDLAAVLEAAAPGKSPRHRDV